MELTLYQFDAFANRPFSGNPAAVVPLEDWLPDEVLQNIALENNLSETAFFVPAETDAGHDYLIRWFTPATEVPLCGHATLATAAALFVELEWPGDEIRFETNNAGLLIVRRKNGMVELDFPALPAAPIAMPTGLEEALGIQPSAFLRAVKNMAVFEDEAAVHAVRPDLDFILTLDGDGLIVTAPGTDCDCVSRYFAPHAGIDEDPVTGSAHCTIIPYWTEKLGKSDIYARQVSMRGGDLYCQLVDDRVRMAGRVRLYMKGTIVV